MHVTQCRDFATTILVTGTHLRLALNAFFAAQCGLVALLLLSCWLINSLRAAIWRRGRLRIVHDALSGAHASQRSRRMPAVVDDAMRRRLGRVAWMLRAV